jgi:hypothetical protein
MQVRPNGSAVPSARAKAASWRSVFVAADAENRALDLFQTLGGT